MRRVAGGHSPPVDFLLLRPGEGETVSDRPQSFVQIKADRDELALTESRYGPGESGPGPHVHREHADCFWVLGGELIFELGGELHRVGAGGFVLIPPNVVHAFRNEGPGDARFLNMHAPSMGFPDHIRALHRADGEEEERQAAERFDTFQPPADGGRPASEALVCPAGEGEALALGPNRLVFKATAEHGGGPMSLWETRLAPGFPGPVPHWHASFLDSFWVLEGTLSLRLADEAAEAAAGSFALAPPGTVHTFSNPGDEPVRFLSLMAPAGFERYLREVAAATPTGAPPDPVRMAEIASRYDFHPRAERMAKAFVQRPSRHGPARPGRYTY